MPKFLTGGSLLTCLSKLELLANCDDDRLSKDRVSVLKSEEEERPFNWHLFFSFLWSYIGYLLAAIAV